MKIGLEIHGYIPTKEKLFCDCKAIHGAKVSKPNSNICPICTGTPGSKPMLPNSEAINKILEIGLILGCKINSSFSWQRKHYDWPDLPKGFQTTISGTYAVPVGEKGRFLDINIKEVHLEEDPAAWDPESGEIDYNRSGIPLVEIVTEPDFKTSEQVVEWIKQLLLTLNYIKAIDKDLGLKADVNISFPEIKGERVEIKNVNSLENIQKAIEYEENRQLVNGDKAKEQETRRFDSKKGITVKMRSKESGADYRFISEPDLPTLKISKEKVAQLEKTIPETPQTKLKRIIKTYKIDPKSGEILTKNLELVDFFEQVVSSGKVRVSLALPWVTVELLRVLNYNKTTLDKVKISPEHFAKLLKLVEEKKLTELKAKEILNKFVPHSFDPEKISGDQSVISGSNEITTLAKRVIKENPKAVEDYKSGKLETINFLIGQLMKLSNKRADYKTAKTVLERLLR